MNGLELSGRYYRETCAPMLARRFPFLVDRISAGLVGEGSECLGFDDELSRDHDWGAAICLWLHGRDYEEYGDALKQSLRQLPAHVSGYPVREENSRTSGRAGVLEIGQFYFRHIGLRHAPDSLAQWLMIPEENLAAATNGAVFSDPSGVFSGIRNQLLAFYPEDVRRKKIAARCAKIAQAGQYNYPRCVSRKERVAATMAEALFIDAVCSAVFLLNRRYKPFYKWMHRGLRELPILGQEVHGVLLSMADERDGFSANGKRMAIERICGLLAGELKCQKLSDAESDFLLDHGLSVQSGIRDESIRRVDILLG